LYKLRRLWWSVSKPLTVGVRVFLFKDGALLLVRHTYQNAWYLVGGGVETGETLEQAIRREAAEEVGAELGDLVLFGVYSNFYEGKSDHVIVYVCTSFTLSGLIDGEIERFSLFEPYNLPEGTSPGTRRRVQEYLEEWPTSTGLW
jgi:ADP-ribose pyrophosphatase YjhB (NUDIX family)